LNYGVLVVMVTACAQPVDVSTTLVLKVVSMHLKPSVLMMVVSIPSVLLVFTLVNLLSAMPAMVAQLM
tara:strand:+ start:1208 stop:1411 length:204 start_codon:yes stop_codon:yes gene_type:complete